MRGILLVALGSLAVSACAGAAPPPKLHVAGIARVGVPVTVRLSGAASLTARKTDGIVKASLHGGSARLTFPSSGLWRVAGIGTIRVRPPAVQVTSPYDAVVAPDGSVVVADGRANALIRVDARTGATRTLASFETPRDVAIGADGAFYVPVKGDKIMRVDPATGDVRVAANLDALAVAFDLNGDLLITKWEDRLDRIHDGAVTTVADGLAHPHGVAVAPDGTIYVSATYAGEVRRLGARPAVVASGLANPSGLTVAPNGDLVVAEFYGGRIARITPAGRVTTFAGSLPGPGGVAVAPDGSAFVADLQLGLFRIGRDGKRTLLGR